MGSCRMLLVLITVLFLTMPFPAAASVFNLNTNKNISENSQGMPRTQLPLTGGIYGDRVLMQINNFTKLDLSLELPKERLEDRGLSFSGAKVYLRGKGDMLNVRENSTWEQVVKLPSFDNAAVSNSVNHLLFSQEDNLTIKVMAGQTSSNHQIAEIFFAKSIPLITSNAAYYERAAYAKLTEKYLVSMSSFYAHQIIEEEYWQKLSAKWIDKRIGNFYNDLPNLDVYRLKEAFALNSNMLEKNENVTVELGSRDGYGCGISFSEQSAESLVEKSSGGLVGVYAGRADVRTEIDGYAWPYVIFAVVKTGNVAGGLPVVQIDIMDPAIFMVLRQPSNLQAEQQATLARWGKYMDSQFAINFFKIVQIKDGGEEFEITDPQTYALLLENLSRFGHFREHSDIPQFVK